MLVALEDIFPTEILRAAARSSSGGGAFFRMVLGPGQLGGQCGGRLSRTERNPSIAEHLAGGGAIVVDYRFAHAELVEEDKARGFDGGRHDKGARVLAELDVGVGETQAGEDDAVGGQRFQFATVAVLVWVAADQDKGKPP